MASGFPASIDNFTDPLSNSPLNSPSHSALHSDVNDAVEKIETYMGLVKVIPTGATNGTVGSTGNVTIGNGVSSVTVSGAFSSLYDNYKIMISGGVGSGNNDLYFNFDGNTAGYYSAFTGFAYGGGSLFGINRSNIAYFDFAGGSSTSNIFANFEIMSPFLTKQSGYTSIYVVPNTSGSTVTGSGFHNNTSSFTGFRIATSAGTLTGGTIRVYGYRN